MADHFRLTPQSKKMFNDLAKVGKMSFIPTLKVIGIGYRKEAQQVFEREQPRVEGLSWPRLSPKYADWKRKHFPGKKMMRRTDRLFDAMTSENAIDNISEITPLSGVFGESTPYGMFHQSKKPRSKVPLRDFATPSDRRIGVWRNQLEDDIINQFNINGIEVKKGGVFINV